MRKYRSLELAEYISLGFSGVGLIAAAVSQQVVYAAIPLMINLPIGLTNRRRLDRRIDDMTTQVLPASQSAQVNHIARIEAGLDRMQDRLDLIDRASPDLINLEQLNRKLNARDRSLHEYIHNFTNLKQQLTGVQCQLTELSENYLNLQLNTSTLIDRSSGDPIAEITKIIQKSQREIYYELVIDRSGSRQVLIDSLAQAERSISIICPWISDFVIHEISDRLEAALDRNINISIGWGHLSDLKQSGNRHKLADRYVNLNRDNLLKLNPQNWKYGGIPILEKMQEKYPGQLTLKVVGTHEKFLICDNMLAMIGSHNFLTSGESSPERELGVKTNDPYIIDRLIARFNQPNLAKNYTSSILN